ncbi:MAG: DUF4922 domain-containing protein [Bacteroides sp.]|nr:DUF4922 domain-containing protein [Bacteroides sp.]MCM1413656.1 DUF4922 domain-containing protein [Bacteroides sp.]MCM1471835.1 DUF4922 domain-containing protein [Bacteroides sp.]
MIETFVKEQLAAWPVASANYHDLESKVIIRRVVIARRNVILQHNPARRRSTAAKVDAESIASRRCFLCRCNRPSEQFAIDIPGYEILLNPYPIFPNHLVIASKSHTPQQVVGRLTVMLDLAARLKGFTVFYNGARCGASAPDHMHFQAAPSDCFPIWHDVEDASDSDSLIEVLDINPGVIMVRHHDAAMVVETVENVMAVLPRSEEDIEAPVNILARISADGAYEVLVIPRRRHRPLCYGSGPDDLMISPASVDLAGVIVVPREEDYQRITAADVNKIIADTCLTVEEINSRLCQL